ncbi:unnamed protein product, partial [Closterium sp. Yama58-4]
SFTGITEFPDNPLYNITWLEALSVECVPGGVVNETFPSTISNLAQLTRLRVKDCSMGTNGGFSMLSSLTSLVDVELPSNGVLDLSSLHGLGFAKLQNLNLSANTLQSNRLLDLNSLTSLTSLDMSHNRLEGDQLLQRITLPSLHFLDLSHNQLSGFLPESFTTMTSLDTLDVGFNKLQGTIPPSFGSLNNLSTLATGSTSLACPDRYSSCGVPQYPSTGFCRKCADFCTSCDKSQLTGKAGVSVGAIVGAVVAACAALLGLALILYYCCFNARQQTGTERSAQHTTGNQGKPEWRKAGPIAMVCGSDCRGRAMVAVYAVVLGWVWQRVDILIGAARGFEYLHSFGIVHRDIKPANILLDGNMQLRRGDAGANDGAAGSRCVGVQQPSTSEKHVSNTLFVPCACMCSFGVVMLELMTGRAAVQESPAPGADEEGHCLLTIVSWVGQQLQKSSNGPVPGLQDPRMEARDDLVLAVVQLALRCTARRTAARPDMGTIATELSAVMAQLGGSKRNTAAKEVDRQMEEFEPARSMEEEFARINARSYHRDTPAMNRGGNPAANRAAARQHHQARRDDDHHESPAAPATVTKPARRRVVISAAEVRRLNAQAGQLREVLGKSKAVSEEMITILNTFDARLTNLETAMRPIQARTLAFRKAHANIDATIRAVETVLDKFDIPQQVEQRIKDGPRRDLEAYLAAVDMLQEALLFFDSHRNYKSSEGAALQARGLMKEAMGMLEADFRQLLANNSKPMDVLKIIEAMPELGIDLAGLPPPAQTPENLIPGIGPSKGGKGPPVLLLPTLIERLNAVARRMIQNGAASACTRVYREVRGNCLEQSLKRLGVEMVTRDDVLRMQWEELETKIGNWIQFIKICVVPHHPYSLQVMLLPPYHSLLTSPCSTPPFHHPSLPTDDAGVSIGARACYQVFAGLDPHREISYAEMGDRGLSLLLSLPLLLLLLLLLLLFPLPLLLLHHSLLPTPSHSLQMMLVFPLERELCYQVFAGLDPHREISYAEMGDRGLSLLLSFGEAIASSQKSPEKLFVLLDMYETIRDSMPMVIDAFPGNACIPCREYLRSLQRSLAEISRDTFSEFEDAVEKDSTRTPVADGTVHPLTSYVINYVKFLFDYEGTLRQLFEEAEKERGEKDWQGGDPSARQKPRLEVATLRILTVLESNLEAKAKLYKDLALTQLFLMNNKHYIVRSIRKSEQARQLVGEEWIQRHRKIVQQHQAMYQKLAWSKVLTVLSPVGEVINKNTLKERLKVFNFAFEEQYNKQLTWTIPDAELQKAVRQAVIDQVLPAYRDMLKRYGPVVDSLKNLSKHVKYQPEDIERLIRQLFEGRQVVGEASKGKASLLK